MYVNPILPIPYHLSFPPLVSMCLFSMKCIPAGKF